MSAEKRKLSKGPNRNGLNTTTGRADTKFKDTIETPALSKEKQTTIRATLDLYIKFLSKSKKEPPKIDDGILFLNGQTRYISLEKIVQKYKLDMNLVRHIIHPYLDSGWVIYKREDNKELTPYFKVGMLRELLIRHNLPITQYRNKKHNKRWEFTDSKQKRVLTQSDMTITSEGTAYSRPEYWADQLEINKGRFSQLIGEITDTLSGVAVKGIIEFPNMGEPKEQRKHDVHIRYMSPDIVQEVVNRYESARLLPETISGSDISPELLHSIVYWTQKLKPKDFRDHSQRISYSSNFINEFRSELSYVKTIQGVKIRTYTQESALRAHNRAIPKTKQKAHLRRIIAQYQKQNREIDQPAC